MEAPRKTLPALVATPLLLLSTLVAALADARAVPAAAPLTRRTLLSPGAGVAQELHGRLVTASFTGEGGRCVVALSRADAARAVLAPGRAVRLEDPAGGLLALTCGHGAARMLVERRSSGA